MQKLFFIALVSCVAIVPATGIAADLKSDLDRQSYALGYQYGSKLQDRGIEIAPNVLLEGIQDALKEKGAQMNDKEIMEALYQMQKALKAKEMKQEAANIQKEAVYLAMNKKKAGVVETASGLQYKVMKRGVGGQPGPQDTVVVHYRGSLINGKEFDSSYKRGKPATFQVNRVISGWQEALQLMRPGAKLSLVIPYQLAYGEAGSPPTIPPRATLLFEVELLEVK